MKDLNLNKYTTSTLKRKWNDLKIRDKKFTYIVVVDFGLVKSTRKKRSGRKKVDKNEVVDNGRKKNGNVQ